jgi:hypothetical protein
MLYFRPFFHLSEALSEWLPDWFSLTQEITGREKNFFLPTICWFWITTSFTIFGYAGPRQVYIWYDCDMCAGLYMAWFWHVSMSIYGVTVTCVQVYIWYDCDIYAGLYMSWLDVCWLWLCSLCLIDTRICLWLKQDVCASLHRTGSNKYTSLPMAQKGRVHELTQALAL